ncbi:hypothetical protein Nepgr_031367 [Nepenthes gracilis]|uniref:Uncharacterized protein n=1 Tax=Nepenthes gracilis TaxID=150966 RepID=A0AAD3TI54_NEPGR|nr:hypothetical protein Nepgr_031367 [Nepenthes gracilis]
MPLSLGPSDDATWMAIAELSADETVGNQSSQILIEGFISSQSLHTSATTPLSKAESHFTATAAYHPAASLSNSSVAKAERATQHQLIKEKTKAAKTCKEFHSRIASRQNTSEAKHYQKL